jgi:UDP-glucose 4-epimerase
MRIVITGASGNLGSALVRRLGNDDHELVGISRRAPDNTAGNIDWVTADLTEDSAAPVLRDAFAGADAVVHRAWGFQPSHDLAYLEELGIGGTRRVLEAATAASVPHLVHTSRPTPT